MRAYTFLESVKGGEAISVEVQEKDLKEEHFDLMAGTMIRDFENLPLRSQGKVAKYIMTKIMQNSDFEYRPKQR